MGLPLVGDTEYRRNRAQCDRKVLEHLNRPLVVSKIFFIFSSENWGRRSPILMMQYFSNGLGNQPTIQDHSFTNCALSFLIYEVILCQFVCHWSLGVSDPIRLVFWDFEKNIISQK